MRAYTVVHAFFFFFILLFFFDGRCRGRETTGGRVKLESESESSWKAQGWGRGGQREWGRGRKTGRVLAFSAQTSSREWELLYNGQVARLHNLHTPAGKRGKKRKEGKKKPAAAAAWQRMIGLPIPPRMRPVHLCQKCSMAFFFFFFFCSSTVWLRFIFVETFLWSLSIYQITIFVCSLFIWLQSLLC